MSTAETVSTAYRATKDNIGCKKQLPFAKDTGHGGREGSSFAHQIANDGMQAQSMRRLLLGALCSFVILVACNAQADINIISRYVPQAQEVGSGRLRFLFWDVYDATLYAPDSQWSAKQPYALSISYLRKLSGKDIAQTSAEAIRDLGFPDEATLAEWHRLMLMIFPDVDENTTLIGMRNSIGQTIFYNNEKMAGIITDPNFADWFFGIWLNEKTQKPQLRRDLLGLQK